MFLCRECHGKANCNDFVCTLNWEDVSHLSKGPCAKCGKVDLCCDCHNYHFENSRQVKRR